MTALAKDRLATVQVEFPHKGTYPAASGAGPFYAGALVAKDASGRAVVPTADDGFVAVGVSIAHQTNASGAAGAVNIEVAPGVVPLKLQGAAPKPGQRMYYVDDQTVSVTTGTTGARGFAGICTEYRNSTVYVLVGPLVWGVVSTAGATGAATA